MMSITSTAAAAAGSAVCPAPVSAGRRSRCAVRAQAAAGGGGAAAADGAPEQKSLEIMRKFSEQYARRSSTFFCSDKSVTAVVIKKDHTRDSNGEEPLTSSEQQMSVKSSKGRGGRWERANFKIVLSYHGGSFDGWQKQPGLNTVQGLVEKHLGQFVDERKAKQLQERSLPIEGCATVAGRTDKGVTALQQVCSFC